MLRNRSRRVAALAASVALLAALLPSPAAAYSGWPCYNQTCNRYAPNSSINNAYPCETNAVSGRQVWIAGHGDARAAFLELRYNGNCGAAWLRLTGWNVSGNYIGKIVSSNGVNHYFSSTYIVANGGRLWTLMLGDVSPLKANAYAALCDPTCPPESQWVPTGSF